MRVLSNAHTLAHAAAYLVVSTLAGVVASESRKSNDKGER